MIEKMLQNTLKYLPLRIKGVEWNEPILNIYGDNWTFATMSSWRMSDLNKVLYSCCDSNNKKIFEIKNLSIIDIKCQEPILKVDPVFILSNGSRLEIFATDTFESWTFEAGKTGLYIGAPTEPETFDPNEK